VANKIEQEHHDEEKDKRSLFAFIPSLNSQVGCTMSPTKKNLTGGMQLTQ
jgi:hypothetical protein